MSINQQRQFVQYILKYIYRHQANEAVYNGLANELFQFLKRCTHEDCLSRLRRSLEELFSCGEVKFNPSTRNFENDGEGMAAYIYNVLYSLCPSAAVIQIQNVPAAA